MRAEERIKAKGHQLGFELVGIAGATPAPDYDFFRWWLDQGFAGTMEYLRRGAERRGDPGKILPGVRSVICCGMNYFAGGAGIPVSRYAQGEDYHRVLGERLAELEGFIRQEIDPDAGTKRYVDTGAILERSYAARAGLGWIGKNTMLIQNGLGSYLFLGEILTTLTLEPDRPVLDQCGTCTRCLDACPTAAFAGPYLLDANRCISYLTIEYRGDFSPEQERMVRGHLYGCDICQEVCPYNEQIPVTPLPAFQPRAALQEKEFSKMVNGSAMERIREGQWKRNLEAVKRRFPQLFKTLIGFMLNLNL